MAQTFKNHAHRPVPTAVGYVLAVAALVMLISRWSEIDGPMILLCLCGSVLALLYISRVYTTKLQDRIIRLEVRLRAASLLTPEQQRLLMQLTPKQIVAVRFASDPELGPLVERASREQLPPKEIKRAIKQWVPDLDRT